MTEICLVFDKVLHGFAKWCRRRLELLGFKVLIVPEGVSYCDEHVVKWGLMNCEGEVWIVTSDKNFILDTGYDKIILLPHAFTLFTQKGRPKKYVYEELWTILCKNLNKLGLVKKALNPR